MMENIVALLQQVKPDFSAEADRTVYLSSLQMMNFLMKLEQQFDMEIDFEAVDIMQLNTLDAFRQLVEETKKQS